MHNPFRYQRLIFGYHGCDQEVTDKVITNSEHLTRSENDYDWLGHGIYFWEQGTQRAYEWAQEQQKRGKIKTPSVIGSVIQLGNCFDLLDRHSTSILANYYPEFENGYQTLGKSIPNNTPAFVGDAELLYRRLDCAVINWTLNLIDKDKGVPSFDSVRGLFQEGDPVYENSGIRRKSHIQIAVRNTACILGYFQPR